MEKREYKKIVWGIALMALIFAAPFLLPRAGKVLVHAYNALAQATSAPSIQSLDPSEGHPNTPVNVTGSGFTVGNTVNFGNIPITNVQSSDGTFLTFTVPSNVPSNATLLASGDYNVPVTVTNGRGTSNALTYIMLCSLGDCNTTGGGGGGNGTSTGGVYPGQIYTCAGGFNCIEGFKVPWNLDLASPQTVTLDGTYRATTTSWSFDQIPSGLHTVSVTVPTDWYSGYTICINNVTCHTDLPIQGDSVSVNFMTTSQPPFLDSNGLLHVPAGSYIDLYWHFSQNFSDFGSAPPGIGGGNVTGTSTVQRSQVSSYTAGGAASVGPGQDYLQNLQAATAQTAVNALGCTIGNILTPAIRGTIVGDAALLANPRPAQFRGGGGASIIVDDRGFTGVVRQLLPYITGNTLQSANDMRYDRAANVGFPNQPSWDAVTYCLENAMIKYVHQSTLNWMYTAFNGNPGFVQNLSQFMLGIENQTARNFFNKIQTTSTDAPFHGQLMQNLVTSYNQSKSELPRYNAAAVNQPGLDGWFALTQNDENNIYGSTHQNLDRLAQSIHYERESEQLKYLANQGQLNIDECTGSSNPDADGNPTNCRTQVTGSQAAKKFDTLTSLAAEKSALNSGDYDKSVLKLINDLVDPALGQLFEDAQPI